ncbi:protein-disulfide reductase DsbD family protein [Thermaurantiacus sp.]
MVLRLLILLGLLAPLGHGPAVATSVSQQPNTRVELLAESRTPRAGETLTIAVAMTARPGWHTYWVNPGEAGIETRAQWQVPAGASVSAFRYPVPKTYLVGGIMNHVFEGEAVLLADVAVPADARGAFPIGVKLDWLVCDDSVCVPESAELLLPLTIGDGAPDPGVAARFAAAEAALPQPLEEPGTFQLADGRFRMKAPIAAEGVRSAHFFALRHDLLAQSAPQRLGVHDGALVIETDAPANPGARESLARGVLRVERADGSVLGFDLNLIEGAVPPGRPLDPGPVRTTTFWSALGLALLGGLLLNLMPCVFPILSLKAMSLAKAGTSPKAARTEGLAYTAGVVLSCMALGAVAIALARAGEGAGWAFQLQDPRVILLLLLLVLAIGLNFAGLFEFRVGSANFGAGLAARPGAQGAFGTGMLAAFVATPCTGPFMAGALGAAILLPTAAGLAVFAGLGLGLALPFLLIGLVPALRRALPRPGPWMQTFRRFLAIPMLLTAVALAWVLGRQAGVNALAFGLLAALLVALGLWWVGLRQSRLAPAALPVALSILAAVAGPLLLPRLAAAGGAAATAAVPAGLAGVAFSPQALAERIEQRAPTFLYFTADWCITCKVNEKGVLSSPRVVESFRKAGVTVMVGDWTRPNPEIARFLEARGRAGIPLYLFYSSDGTVHELPQILTVEMLTGLANSSSSKAV